MLKAKKIGFMGGGAMAEIMLRGLIQGDLVTAEQITVSDVKGERLRYLRDTLGVDTCTHNQDLVRGVDILFLTVKPQTVDQVMTEVGLMLESRQLLISVAAGISTQTLEQYIKGKVPVVRVMPNIPALVGEGATAITLGRFAGETEKEIVTTIFRAVGRVVTVTEDMMDAVTGLSGSGPAYVSVIIEALADGGVRVGLPRDVSLALAAQTLLGAAKMVLTTHEHPGSLKDTVCSPGGTAIAGIQALEEGGLRAALINAVVAATLRAQQLGQKHSHTEAK